MVEQNESAWQRFWNRGGFWRALLLVVVYYAVYQGLGLLISTVFASQIDAENPFGSPQSVFFGVTASILVVGILLMLFALTLRWLPELFGRQPIRGSWWMWIAVVIVLAFNIVRFAAVDYDAFSPWTIVSILFLGFCVGFTEELLTRGLVVNLLRKHGYGEWVVMVLSSLFFAALHSGNILSGQNPIVVALTVVYTFAFGIAMYLTLRVTGNLIWPILLHATTDPSVFLLSGGIDVAGNAGDVSPLLPIAGLANPAVMIFAIIPLIFVRGRVKESAEFAKV